MKVYCEKMFFEILPTLRALLVERMSIKYKLTQIEIAKKLGTTQSAISQYKKGFRGKNSDIIDLIKSNRIFMSRLNEIADKLAESKICITEAICKICENFRNVSNFNESEYSCIIRELKLKR